MTCRFIVGKPDGKGSLGRPRYNIDIGIKEAGCALN